MPDFSSLNWVAIVVATLAYFALSWAWFGPLFGKNWADGMGYDSADMKPEPKHFIVTLGGYFVLMTALAGALDATGAESVVGAVKIAAWLWLGFIASTTLAGAIWDSRPLIVWEINAGLSLVGMILASIIMTAWPF